jgi:YidC/Oxa1 family membrane protein insertase
VNRNLILGFLIILVGIQFFTSKTFYKMIDKPYPFGKKKEVVQEEKESEEKRAVTDSDDELTEETEGVPFLGKVDKEESAAMVRNTVSAEKDTSDKADTVAVVKIDTVWVETDKLVCGISERGGRIISVKTKEYTYDKQKKGLIGELIELVGNGKVGGANLTINNKDFDKELFKFSGEAKRIDVKSDGKKSLQFVYINKENKKLVKEFTFHNGIYRIGYKIHSEELNGNTVEAGWKCGIRLSGKVSAYDKKRIHFFDNDKSEHFELSKENTWTPTGDFKWIAVTSKYFAIALIADELKSADIAAKSHLIKQRDDHDDKKKKVKEARVSFAFNRFCDKNEESYSIYIGPTKTSELKKMNVSLDKILFGVASKMGKVFATIFIGGRVWFPHLCNFVLWLMIALQKLVIDYGIVIIILTILLKIVTYPLTTSSMKSMNKMKDTQPKINQIREKYKGNTQKMNQKIMEFYKKEGINPLGGMGGCLPMILQMPIFISLFVVLRKAIELRGEGTFLIPWINDLSQAEVLFPIGMNIPMYGSNFALLPLLNAIIMFFQQKATIKDPNQKAMVYMMPVMMLVLFNNFPSGLVLYFTFSTALQWLQQIVMDKYKKKPAK